MTSPFLCNSDPCVLHCSSRAPGSSFEYSGCVDDVEGIMDIDEDSHAVGDALSESAEDDEVESENDDEVQSEDDDGYKYENCECIYFIDERS